MSIRLALMIAFTCCVLLACQTRTTLVEAPRAPTPTFTAQPLIAASPPPSSPAASPVAPVSPVAASPVGVSPTPVPSLSSPSPVAVAPAPTPCPYAGTRRLVEVQDRALAEASALASSQRWPGVYWTLNDSGNSPSVYAVDDQGRSRGTYSVEGAQNVDWEAMQVGPGRNGVSALYIGDIGDNDRERREIVLYRVPEPQPAAAGAGSSSGRTSQAEAFKLQYPDGARDAEGLLVHPTTGEILIVTKEILGRAGVYRVPLPLDDRRTARLERVTEVDMARAGVKIDVVTDTTVAPDARRVTIRTYGSALEYEVPPGAALASIWEQMPRVARLDDGPQGEGISYRSDGRALITIGESTPAYLYETARQC